MRYFQARDESAYRRELKQVRKAREQVAAIWVQLPDHQLSAAYAGDMGQTHKTLISRLLSERPDSTKEQQQAARLRKKLCGDLRETGAVGRLLAAMVYNRAHDLPRFYALETLPAWLLRDYVQYMTNPAFLFCTPGENGRYLEHMRRWVDYLHRSIMENPTSRLWQDVANHFVQVADVGPLYFNDQNVKKIYAQRGDIIDYVLRSQGCAVDHEFTPRKERTTLRIGILCAHCQPSPETYAMLPLFEHLDDSCEVVLYVFTTSGGALEQYCQSRVYALKALPAGLKNQSDFIRQDDLDILFVATNITSACNSTCYLAAHRLARVQLAGAGSVTTTGLPNMDYYLTGRLTDQEQNTAHYRETLLWLDGPAHCFSYGPTPEREALTVSRAQLGIPDDVTVYASGANVFKIVPELMAVWAKLLRSCKDSVLMLYPYGPNWSSSYPKELFAQRLGAHLKAEGVSVQRLFILDPDPVPDRYQIREYLRVADVYLDSFPFSSTTSLIEPLELGLPVISRSGANFRTSMGSALLNSLGMKGLVTHSEDEYIKLAEKVGEDFAWRQSLNRKICAAMQARPPFLDSEGYSRQVGLLFRDIARKVTANS